MERQRVRGVTVRAVCWGLVEIEVEVEVGASAYGI
jgi:hypothetical protein